MTLRIQRRVDVENGDSVRDEMHHELPWQECECKTLGVGPTRIGDEYDDLDYTAISHAESTRTLLGTQSASVVYNCLLDCKQTTRRLRRDKFSS